MTGILSVLTATGGRVLRILSPLQLDVNSFAPATCQGRLLLQSDGTITRQTSGTDNSSTLGNWFVPTTAAVGVGYWVKFTLLTGTAWNSGPVSGVLTNLATDRKSTRLNSSHVD